MFYQRNHLLRYRPLLGGVVVYNPSCGVEGTIALIAQHPDDDQDHWIVSAYHVLARRGQGVAADGEPVFSPSSDALASLSQAGPVAHLAEDRRDAAMDVAAARVAPGTMVSPEIIGIGPVLGVKDPTVGMRVVKSGIASGVTQGRIVSVSGSAVRIEPHPDWSLEYNLSDTGDSGAAWVEEGTGLVVAIHTKGETGASEASIAVDAPKALTALGLRAAVSGDV